MDSNCYECSKPIKTLEFMQCKGFCSQAAHLKCVGLKRPNMDFVNEHVNLLWFCDCCIEHLNTTRDNPVPKDIVEAVKNVLSDSLAELKVELQETKQLTASLNEKVQSNSTTGLNQARPVWPSVKRSREIAARETPRSRPMASLIGGTKSVEKQNLIVPTVAKPPEKFWIYVSRIARHVTEKDVAELVKECLQTEQPVDVRKLVRRDADLSQLAFISFKVGVDINLKENALDPSIWPKGIFFREFENIRSERDFWGPSKTPRIDGTPSTAVPILTNVTTPSQ